MWFHKISIPPPQKVIGNSEGKGVSKAKFFKQKYQSKLEFPEGWGIQTKRPSVGGVWIFCGTTQLALIPEVWIPLIKKHNGRSVPQSTCMYQEVFSIQNNDD